MTTWCVFTTYNWQFWHNTICIQNWQITTRSVTQHDMWDNTSGIYILTRPVSLLANGSIIYDLWPQQTVDHRSVYWNRFTSDQLLCQMTNINGILNGHDHRCIIAFTPVGRNTMPCGPHNPGAWWYPLTLLDFQWAIQQMKLIARTTCKIFMSRGYARVA